MATKASSSPHKIVDIGEPVERGYAAWKQSKVERGLEQTKDRATLIAADKVWRELGLEG